MRIINPQTLLRWLPGLCLSLTLAGSAARAVDTPTDIVVPLTESLLTHLETTATNLAAKERGDRALKKEFETIITDKKITGTTFSEITSSMATRHPRAAAALAAEGWKLDDFYLAYLTLISMPYMSELSHGGVPDQDKRVRRNVILYDQHKARVDALIEKMGPLTGLAEKRE